MDDGSCIMGLTVVIFIFISIMFLLDLNKPGSTQRVMSSLLSLPGLFRRENYNYGHHRGHSYVLKIIAGAGIRDVTRLTLQERSVAQYIHINRSKESLSSDGIRLLIRRLHQAIRVGQVEADPGGQKIHFRWPGRHDHAETALLDVLCDLAEAYPRIIAAEGAVMPLLHEISAAEGHILQPLATQMMRDIAARTLRFRKLTVTDLLCPHCLVRFDEQTLQPAQGEPIHFYGCRACYQSKEFRHLESRPLIARLDKTMSEEVVWQDQAVIVNWLHRGDLFDFDAVQIIHANDEAVERFAVQVGNDTNLMRHPRYQTMTCEVACELSANTQRILRRTFGSYPPDVSTNTWRKTGGASSS